MKTDDYRKQQSRRMAEADLQSQIVELAKRLGWASFHQFDSRRSDPGWPDLVLIHPRQRRILFRELKTARGRVSDDQQRVLTMLQSIGQDVAVWRPDDLFSGLVLAELRGGGA